MDQGIVLFLLCVFYAAYFCKLLNQKKKNIQTMQMGKGNKSKKLLIVERSVGICTTTIVVVELISVLLGTRGLGKAGSLVGIGLMIIGTGIFIAAMVTMKDSWRAGIPKEDKTELVTAGIYRISRNPAFVGFDIVYIGVLLAFMNVILLIITCLSVAALHCLILQEEKFLIQRFGQDYLEYKKQVSRYLLFF